MGGTTMKTFEFGFLLWLMFFVLALYSGIIGFHVLAWYLTGCTLLFALIVTRDAAKHLEELEQSQKKEAGR
jgi:Flp pilus assembly protein TadB